MSQAVEIDVDEVLGAFETTIRNKPNQADRVSERTATSYLRNARYFIEWLAEERDKDILEANTSDLRVYLRECRADGDKDKTLVTRRSAISRFYGELPKMAEDGQLPVDASACPVNPEEGYDATWTVKSSHKEQESGEAVQYLKPAEVKQLWQHVPAPNLRNKLLIRLGYQTGMRVSEIISIKLQHIDREEREIKVPAVTSKSGSRTVAYKPSLDSLLRRWVDGGLRDAVPYAPESEYLFPTAESEHISRESVRRVVRKAADSADLNHDIYTDKSGNTRTKVSPHILRHSMAVNSLKAGTLNVRELQEFLGHHSLDVTEAYLKIASDDATTAYKQRGGPPEG
ncbi:tyrosine-type recombinase/integrase [Salinigranum sp. GCM10025319]|uniref:tyrosine-type recombinase/integrase n=1 Tax=Salinigranum sp. GCM10025319 TaxID=3252687 RepID=UPI003620B9CC